MINKDKLIKYLQDKKFYLFGTSEYTEAGKFLAYSDVLKKIESGYFDVKCSDVHNVDKLYDDYVEKHMKKE